MFASLNDPTFPITWMVDDEENYIYDVLTSQQSCF